MNPKWNLKKTLHETIWNPKWNPKWNPNETLNETLNNTLNETLNESLKKLSRNPHERLKYQNVANTMQMRAWSAKRSQIPCRMEGKHGQMIANALQNEK